MSILINERRIIKKSEIGGAKFIEGILNEEIIK
jgi:hypothetical protein